MAQSCRVLIAPTNLINVTFTTFSALSQKREAQNSFNWNLAHRDNLAKCNLHVQQLTELLN
jgi:hypothetical protein